MIKPSRHLANYPQPEHKFQVASRVHSTQTIDAHKGKVDIVKEADAINRRRTGRVSGNVAHEHGVHDSD